MRIAIYTVALNEAANAAAFMQNCEAADLILVGDSGSTDNTNEIIRKHGGKIVPLTIAPWRFDMARNTVLSVLPREIDFCFAMDLDERFRDPNWRQIIEANWDMKEHTRLRFRYIHTFNADGTDGTTAFKDFAHTRVNYHWQHAVHEQLYYRGAGSENTLLLPEIVVEHRQDTKKSRASYLPLLELECSSNTKTPRHSFWLLREYVAEKMWQKCVDTANEFLRCPGIWSVERMHALRYKAKALSHLGKLSEALQAHMLSIDAAPQERECWLDLAWFYTGRKAYPQAYGAVCQALTITAKPEHYLISEEAWGHTIHVLAATCAKEMGSIARAKEHLQTATRIAPTNKQVQAAVAALSAS